MSIGNVASINLQDGTVIAYAAHDGHINKTVVDYAADANTATQINFTAHGPSDTASVIAVVGRDTTQPFQRHVFYRLTSSNLVFHFLDLPSSDGNNATVTPAQLLLEGGALAVACPGSFGSVVLDDGVMLLGISNDTKQPSTIWVLVIPWASLSVQSWMSEADIQWFDLASFVPAGTTFDRTDCDLSAVVASDQTSNTPTVLFSVKMKNKQGSALYCFSTPIQSGGMEVGAFTLRATSAISKSITYPKLTLRPDHLVQLSYFDDQNLLQMNASPLATILAATSGTSAWPANDDLSIVNVLNKKSTPFDVVFVNGQLQSQPSEANSALLDTKLPLFPAVVYWNGSKIVSSVDSNIWIYLCRTGSPVIPGQKQILLGIVEGPPPIPSENVNMASSYDPYTFNGQPASSMTQFALSQSTTDQFSWSVKSGLLIKAGIKIETEQDFLIWSAEATFEAELALEIAFRLANASISVTAVEQTSTTRAEFNTDPDTKQVVVSPAGSVILMNASWTGYLYEVQDTAGNLIEGPPAFMSVFPTDVSITQEAYTLNPSFAPTPGDLASYQLQAAEIAALDANSAYNFTDNNNYMTATWVYNGTLTPVYSSTQTNTHTETLNVDLTMLIGISGAASLFGIGAEVSLSATVKVGLECSWTTSTTSGVKLSVDVGLRGNVKAPNSYTKYTYDTYLLDESNEWTTELLGELVTPGFPADPTSMQQNSLVLDLIHPDSTPWKICYSVDMTQARFNPPVSSVLASDAALASKYTLPFQSASIDTTEDLSNLLDGVAAAQQGGDKEQHAAAVAKLTHGAPGALLPLLGDLGSAPDDVARLRMLVTEAQQRIAI
jgi:hypothetical protein